MADSYESVLCIKNEIFVYRIPARTTNRGYKAAEWKLDEPDWTGKLKVVAKNRDLSIKLEDKNTGELFAQCPVDTYPSACVEQVIDSSRYFVLRIQDENGRNAFIGIGFADRGDSFDLLVAIQDHFKHVKRDVKVEEDLSASLNPLSLTENTPKLDLGFKEGQTIKLNFATKKSGETSVTKPRPKARNGATILLPPPPGGVRLASSSIKPSTIITPPKENSENLLFDLDFSANTASQNTNKVLKSSADEKDFWDEFANAPKPNIPKPSTNNWVNFE